MNNIILAVPKGRILKELQPFLINKNIFIEDDFFNENTIKTKTPFSIVDILKKSRDPFLEGTFLFSLYLSYDDLKKR